MLLTLQIILSNNMKDSDCKSAGASHAIPALRCVLMFEDRQDYRIPFDKFLGPTIVANDFGDGTKKVEAEI